MSSRTRGVKGSPSTTASEDDLWLATEKKDQKKKKKKRSKISSQEKGQVVKSCDQENPKVKDNDVNELLVQDTFISKKLTNIADAPLDIDIDADYFHTAQEYHEQPSSNTHKSENLLKEFVEPQVEDFQEAQESVVQTLEDFELHAEDDGKEVPSKCSEEVMLKSLHDENDLA